METASVTSTNTVSLEISCGNRVIIDKGSIHCHFRLWYLWEFLPQPNRDNSRLCCSKITKWGESTFPLRIVASTKSINSVPPDSESHLDVLDALDALDALDVAEG